MGYASGHHHRIQLKMRLSIFMSRSLDAHTTPADFGVYIFIEHATLQ